MPQKYIKYTSQTVQSNYIGHSQIVCNYIKDVEKKKNLTVQGKYQ